MTPEHFFKQSPHLDHLYQRYQDYPQLQQASYDQKQLSTFLSEGVFQLFNFDSQKITALASIRHIKNIWSLLWSYSYFSQSISQEDAGRLQSRFAQVTIQLALRYTALQKEFKHYYDKDRACLPGIFVLGLGKLGGFDLNYSSDVDLVAFYDAQSCTIPERLGRTHIITKLLSQMSNLLSNQTSDGFVWRVDWRLRPNASVKYLSMPVEQAFNFYHFQSMPWHRLAMMKAQVVAGDFNAGKQFLNMIASFIWRRHLDMRAIDDIASLKHKINLEHPRLQRQRNHAKEECISHIKSFNFKLGFGGIREVEFIVNAMQLIWGGKKSELQTTHTLTALQHLCDENLIDPKAAQQLRKAYQLFRRCEDALQCMDNQQTHSTPQTEENMAIWLNILGIENRQALFDDIEALREQVHQEFNQLFQLSEEDNDGEFSWKNIKADLSPRHQQIVQDWETGFVIYGAMPSQVAQLSSLANDLGAIIDRMDIDTEFAIEKVDQFLRKLPSGGQYLCLLQKYPHLLETLIPPLLLSPLMGLLLEQSPHIVDGFLVDSPREHPNKAHLDRSFILLENDRENALEKLRSHTNEEKYRLFIRYINNQLNSNELETALSEFAADVLQLALDLCEDHTHIDATGFSIVGLGKLGMKTFMPLSDIDLMYLFDEHLNVEQANKIASQMNTVLHSNMREGRVYELDTRLRPSGRSGSPTISVNSFKQYQFNQAFTWEHIALFPARIVTGSEHIKTTFKQIKMNVLSKARDIHQLKMDALKMWKRIEEQRISSSQQAFISKLRPGGLMQAEYLYACIAIEHAIDHPSILGQDYLSACDNIPELVDINFSETLNFWRRLQIAVHLFGRENTPINELPKPIQTQLLSHLSMKNLDEWKEKIEMHSEKILKLHNKFFAPVLEENLDEWQETKIIWQP